MAWARTSAAAGVDDLCARLNANDRALTSLTLFRGRRFGAPEVAQLAAALRRNTALTELYASSHAMAPASAALLADALRENTTLVDLCVGDAAFGDEGVEALAPGIGRLRRLDVESKSVGPRGAAALAAALRAGAVLAELLAARNPSLGDEGAALLCAAAASSALRVLDLAECGLRTGAGAALGTLLAASPPLHTLRLCDNAELGADGVAALAAGLRSAAALRELDLSGCAVGDAGAAALADALPGAAALAALVLARCGVGAGGAAALAGALAPGCAPQLSQLCLAGNAGVGDAGARALAAALAARATSAAPRLARLDVGECGVAPGGAAALLRAGGAASLVLFGNACADEAAVAAVADAPPSLTSLDLSGTGLATPAAAALCAALAAGAAAGLTTLELGANPMTQDDGWADMAAALRAARPALDVAWRAADAGDNAAQQRAVAPA